MRLIKRKLVFIPLAIAGGVLFVGIGGLSVMLLWNWLLPPLFGWRLLGFWQALGLLALCRMLFGGFGGHSRGPGFRRRRLDRMTPEERERLRERMSQCRGFSPPATE
jgi:hypothetical protein